MNGNYGKTGKTAKHCGYTVINRKTLRFYRYKPQNISIFSITAKYFDFFHNRKILRLFP